ncbi:MAG: hypothetical protein PHT07_14965 [Paludibacter sp.]|nr:hypothetical protein [Paludibacter sp.]
MNEEDRSQSKERLRQSRANGICLWRVDHERFTLECWMTAHGLSIYQIWADGEKFREWIPLINR